MGLFFFITSQHSKMNQEKLNRMQKNVRIGGKGSVRRKHKAVHKKSSASEQKLNLSLKKLGVNQIPGIEEVNLFHDDGTITTSNNQKSKFPCHPTLLLSVVMLKENK